MKWTIVSAYRQPNNLIYTNILAVLLKIWSWVILILILKKEKDPKPSEA